jgi:hypothetical protein
MSRLTVGKLIGLRDVTPGVAAERRAIVVVVAACVAVAAVLFAFSWLFMAIGRASAQ